MGRSCTSLEPGALIFIKGYAGLSASKYKGKIAMYLGEFNENGNAFIELLVEEKVEKLLYSLLHYEMINAEDS